MTDMLEMRPDVYGRGWKFPIEFTTDGVVTCRSGEEDIEQSLRVLLNTLPGERIMRGDLGCDLSAALFENISASLRAFLQTSITDSALRYEPRVAIGDVVIDRDRRDPTCLLIDVIYRIRGSDTVRQLGGELRPDGTGEGFR